MKIGILALQGDVEEHRSVLERIGVETALVRDKRKLDGLDGLVLPGGESTAIYRLLNKWDLFQPLREKGKEGLPVFGTCAGLILMAREVLGGQVTSLEFLDVSVLRNGYGRQIDSFEENINLVGTEREDVHGVFIRAPVIKEAGDSVQVLGKYEDSPVLIRQENFLASSFHPELSDDSWVHEYFVKNVVGGLD